MKQQFEDTLRGWVKRDGVEEFLADLECNGFYEAWASTSFHCNYERGF